MSLRNIAVLVFAGLLASAGFAGSGPFGIDHRLALDETGIWSRENQTLVEVGSAVLLLGGALAEGSETRLGRTLWQSVDSMLAADVAAAAAKAVFRRQRPRDGNDPDAFFASGSDTSFPSGEVTHITAIVTPLLIEYHRDTPAVWLLAALPVYVGAARLQSQAHWQSDVLTGALLGVGTGYLSSLRDKSWSASVLPDGFSLRYTRKF
jgi:undecaprenyl-diphosphatase